MLVFLPRSLIVAQRFGGILLHARTLGPIHFFGGQLQVPTSFLCIQAFPHRPEPFERHCLFVFLAYVRNGDVTKQKILSEQHKMKGIGTNKSMLWNQALSCVAYDMTDVENAHGKKDLHSLEVLSSRSRHTGSKTKERGVKANQSTLQKFRRSNQQLALERRQNLLLTTDFDALLHILLLLMMLLLM